MQPPCFCFCLVYMVAWVAFFAAWLGFVAAWLGFAAAWLGFAAAWLGFVAAWMRSAPSIPSEQARSPIWMDSIQTFLPVPYIRTGEKPYLDGLQANTLPELIHRIFKYFSKDGASLQYRHLSLHPIWKSPLIVGVFPINKHLSLHPIWKSPLIVGVSPLNKLNKP